MLKIKVKASSVTNLTDARYFAAWGVDWIGFDFEEGSDRHLPVVNMRAIREWLDGVRFVGEFGAAHAPEAIAQAARDLQLDAVQLDMFASADAAALV